VQSERRDGTCESGPNTLCLRHFRFSATIELTGDAGGGGGVFANVVPGGTGDSGLFWFFDPTNWEVLLKVLDGCGVTDRFWVFAASTTDQGYVLTITDTLSGEVKQYVNQPGNPAPAITDTDAFATCDVQP
jgi:hypothetical protein